MSKSNDLITDRYYGQFSYEGDWSWSATVGYRSPMKLYPEVWWIEGEPGPNATYNPEIISSGNIRISAYIIGNSENQDTNVEYTVYHNGNIDKVYVDTSRYAKGESDWSELGVFEFCGNGEEFVKITRISDVGVTRAGTLRFEILNDADDIDVWQTIYLGPDLRNLKPVGLIEFDKFCDLEKCEEKYEIEYLLSKGIIDTVSNEFKPFEAVEAKDFFEWLKKASGYEFEFNENVVSIKSVSDILYNCAIKFGKNFEWIHSDKPIEFLTQLGVIDESDENLPLTRAKAAVIIKNFYHTVVTSGVSSDWKLTFCENFDCNVLNPDVWECQNGAPGHILSSRWESNVEIKGNKLRLITKKEKKECCPNLDWTTASVSVKPSFFSQAYGYWEASIKINAAQGINNAFWMAADVEIDVVEAHYKNIVNTNLHHPMGVFSEKYRSNYDLSKDFHVYALEWNEDELIYYFDGAEIARKNSYSTNSPMYPILSTAVLNWAGKIGDEADNCAMEVEWVRVYEKKF